jgi:hypothetical protein
MVHWNKRGHLELVADEPKAKSYGKELHDAANYCVMMIPWCLLMTRKSSKSQDQTPDDQKRSSCIEEIHQKMR